MAKRDRDRLAGGGAEGGGVDRVRGKGVGWGRIRARGGDAGNVRYNDVGSFTVVRHFGTCFPINMHVLVP